MTATSIPDSIERGTFSDGARSFSVRVSSRDAPDSFQVRTAQHPSEIVLVISGLNAGTLQATWGPRWRRASEEWREWCEAESFMVFYNGSKPAVGRVRVCNG